MDNAEQLQKLAQIFNTDRIISKEEISGVLEAIVGILANNKKSIEALTEESKSTLAQTLQGMVDEHNSIVSQVDSVTRETKTTVQAEVKAQLEAVQKRVESLIAECKSLMPQDGKDADEEAIVSEVLKQIKLPEYKEVILDDGGQIVDKINELPVTPENQIDASHIKNLPTTGSGGGGLRRVFHDSTLTGTGTAVDPLVVVGGGGGGGNIDSINADTTAAQLLVVGTSGTDFAIADNGTGTHTFNLPTASATNRGALSSADWTTFNDKFSLPSLTSGSVLFSNGTTIAQDNANFFWDDSNNRLGIGTSSPAGKLEIVSSGTGNNLLTYFSAYENSAADLRPVIFYRRARGTVASPAIVQSGDSIGNFVFYGYDGSAFRELGKFGMYVDGTPGSNDMPGRFEFATTPDGSTTASNRLVILNNGNVGIGQDTPTAYLHTKAGTATASTAPLKFTSGTDNTTAEAGAMEFGSSRLAFTPSGTTRKRVALTNDVTPSNGQIPIGNGTDYTVAAITAGSGISITNGAGSISIAASASTPVVSYDYVIQRSGANTVAIKMSDQSTLSTNTDASVVIQAAVDAIDASTGTGGSIFVKAGTYAMATVVTIAGDNTIDSKAVAIHGDGIQSTIFVPASGTNGFSITNQAKVSLKDFAIYVKGTSNGIISSNSSNGLRAFWQSEFRNIYIYGDDGTHTGYGMDLGNPFRSVFENIEINQVKNGVRMTATDTTTGYNPGDLVFSRSFIELRNVAGGVALEIASPNTGSMNQMIFNMVEMYAGGTGQTGILLSGSAGNNHNNFNGINAEQFDTILDIDYGRNNYFDFNYIITRNTTGTTYFKTQVDSYNNRVSCKYLDTPTQTVVIVNDANTLTLQPNVFTDIVMQGSATTTTFTTTAATVITDVRDNVNGTSRYINPNALKAVDPGADRIPFWDDSTDMMGLLAASTGLTISGTNMTADVSLANTATLSNKRVTKRLVSVNAPGATPTTNTDNCDIAEFTGLSAAITSMTTNLSGTPVNGDMLEFIFLDNGTARAITWGTSFANGGLVNLPTTTVISTVLRVLVQYQTIASLNKWVCIAVA